jgi:hypothetical protein
MESRAVLLVTLFTCCKQISEQHVGDKGNRTRGCALSMTFSRSRAVGCWSDLVESSILFLSSWGRHQLTQ